MVPLPTSNVSAVAPTLARFRRLPSTKPFVRATVAVVPMIKVFAPVTTLPFVSVSRVPTVSGVPSAALPLELRSTVSESSVWKLAVKRTVPIAPVPFSTRLEAALPLIEPAASLPPTVPASVSVRPFKSSTSVVPAELEPVAAAGRGTGQVGEQLDRVGALVESQVIEVQVGRTADRLQRAAREDHRATVGLERTVTRRSDPMVRLPALAFSASVPEVIVRSPGTVRSVVGSVIVPPAACTITFSGTPLPTAPPAPHSGPTLPVAV